MRLGVRHGLYVLYAVYTFVRASENLTYFKNFEIQQLPLQYCSRGRCGVQSKID